MLVTAKECQCCKKDRASIRRQAIEYIRYLFIRKHVTMLLIYEREGWYLASRARLPLKFEMWGTLYLVLSCGGCRLSPQQLISTLSQTKSRFISLFSHSQATSYWFSNGSDEIFPALFRMSAPSRAAESASLRIVAQSFHVYIFGSSLLRNLFCNTSLAELCQLAPLSVTGRRTIS